MAQAQAAYRYDVARDYTSAPRLRDRVRVLPGKRERSSEKQSSVVVILAKMAAVVLLAIALFACARIAINAATVSTLIDSETLSTEITRARSTGIGLEMEQSTLTSQPALNMAVKRFHMSTPEEVGTIVLSADVVATDADGALSLSATIKNAVGTQE